MNPVRLSAALRSLADRIECSVRPSRSAVASELRRVLAAMNDVITVNKVTLVPEEDGGETMMPTFLVDGVWKGKAFSYKVSVELDGRDADWEHVSGVNPDDQSNDEDLDEWMDVGSVAVYDAIYKSDDYKRLTLSS